MDIIAWCDCEEIAEILRDLKFRVRESRFYSARRIEGIGLYHALFTKSNNICYIDLHYDFPFHLLFLGVDYSRRPMKLYLSELKRAFKERGIVHRIDGGFTWFERRNRALLKGMRV
jgi:hypothetical protein